VKITADEVLAYYNRTEFQHGKESRTKWLQEDSRLGHILLNEYLSLIS